MAWLSAIGLMSGTSYDGVDVALINTNGEEIGRIGPTLYRPYSEEERALMRRAMASVANLADRAARPGPPPTVWRRAISRSSVSTARPSCTIRPGG
jgi:1,6-anhydro-N-acetylmuramate kinase